MHQPSTHALLLITPASSFQLVTKTKTTDHPHKCKHTLTATSTAQLPYKLESKAGIKNLETRQAVTT